jgi:hypothetical protein
MISNFSFDFQCRRFIYLTSNFISNVTTGPIIIGLLWAIIVDLWKPSCYLVLSLAFSDFLTGCSIEGIQIWKDRGTYTGQWDDDQMHGAGK